MATLDRCGRPPRSRSAARARPLSRTIELGTAEIELVNDAELWTKSTPTTLAARLTLAHGRIVLHGTTPSLPFEIHAAGKTFTVTPPPGGAVGVERIDRRLEGEPKPQPPLVRNLRGRRSRRRCRERP